MRGTIRKIAYIDKQDVNSRMAVGGGLLAALGRGLFVGADVEVDKEEEVAREESATEESSTLSAGAAAHAREVGPVGSAEVRVA